MQLSKFVSCIKIDNNLYALYNRLIFEPIFLNENEKNNILDGKWHNLENRDINKLKKLGILVNNVKKDELAFKSLKNYVQKEIKNKISLMYIIGNNNCNLACKYCFIGKLNNHAPELMTNEILEIAIDKFAKHISSKELKKGTIVFYGAEPIINFSLIKHAVKYIKNKKYRIQISLVTNGTLLTEEIANFIKRNNIGIGISIDGPKEYNDTMRVMYKSNEGTYESVIKNIKMFQQKRIPFGLSITINDYALKNKEEYLKWLKDLNVKEVTYNLMHYDSLETNWKPYYKKIAKFLFDSNKVLKKVDVNEGRINRKYDAFYKREFKYSDCGAIGANQISIKPNGDITICHGLWNTKESLGNILNLEIEDIFKTEMYKKWNNCLTLNKNECLHCPYIYMCGGGCAMESKNMFGSENALDIPFCIYTENITKLILKEFYNVSKEYQNKIIN